jgi:hypothetical protein
MTHAQLERRVRFLTAYAGVATLSVLVLVLAAARPDRATWFDRLHADVLRADTIRAGVVIAERVEVIEPDGSLALLAANSKRMQGLVLNGREVTTRGGAAGLIFYYQGKEVGGLIYRQDTTRAEPYALGHLSLDQYRSDQVVLMQYEGSGPRQRAGFYVNDLPVDFDSYDYLAFIDSTAALPENERDAARAQLRERQRRGDFGGRRVALESRERVAALRLSDYRGRERLRATVDSLGAARIEFLNAEGNVVRVITAEH